MRRQRLLNPSLVGGLALWALVLGSVPGGAIAMPTASVAQLQPMAIREAQIASIMQVMHHPQAQLQLRLAGISPTQVREGLAKLDDAQLASVARRAEAVKAGGELVGLIIALLVVAILVVILITLLHKDIDVKDRR